ncbi:hypothetical protein BDZ89DRAFT_1116825 [Hymenopellis radicata]|nr:hypothetical protein BDZ89DRAFT_1116825 [Hymenopellis radicata]
MAFNSDSSSFSEDTNNNDSDTFRDYSDSTLDAFLASHYTKPMPSENLDPLQAPDADDFRTPIDLSAFFKNYNPPTDLEAPLTSPELPKIDTSLVDLNPQDTTDTDTDYPAQPDFASGASYYQPQPFDVGDQASTTSYDENQFLKDTLPSYDKDQARAYPSYLNGNQGNAYDKHRAYTSIYDVNQAHNSVYDVNQPFPSVALLPSQLDFTQPANFNSVAPYVPQAGGSSAAAWPLAWSGQIPSTPTPATSDMPQLPSGSNDLAPSTHTSSASPEVESAPSVPLAHSSLGSTRRRSLIRPSSSKRKVKTQEPHASARNKRAKCSIPSAPSGLNPAVRDCPPNYTTIRLPASGLNALRTICPNTTITDCYKVKVDSQGCCVPGCPEAHVHYGTRAEFWVHMKTHPEILEILKILALEPDSGNIHKCPIGECTHKYGGQFGKRSFEKHIENSHVDMHVLCPFCSSRQAVQENIGRHFESCKALHPALR